MNILVILCVFILCCLVWDMNPKQKENVWKKQHSSTTVQIVHNLLDCVADAVRKKKPKQNFLHARGLHTNKPFLSNHCHTENKSTLGSKWFLCKGQCLSSGCFVRCMCKYTHLHRENANDHPQLLIFGSTTAPKMSSPDYTDSPHW